MKKIIKALLVVMVVVLALTAFVACEQEQKVCQHTGGTATCTEAAVCEICGESYGTALGHKEVKLPAIEATCSKEGRTEGSRCSECKETLVPQETIEKLEHVWVANEDRDFTCELDGFTGGNHCENCGVQDGTVVITPAHCVWGEDYVDVEPTCGKAGVLAHDCTVCGKTEKVADIPATGKHSFTVDVEAKDPTCLPGYTAHKACEVCGARDPETFVEIPGDDKNGHLFEEENYVVYAEPTCTEAGLLAGYCTHCGKLYGLAELPAAHKYVDGVCTECGAQEPAHEHTWADATCTAPKTCETCGATEGEALAHTYVKGICSVCEAKDPAYVDYYLVGYINGADYGCEGDYANLGEYKFVDGKLVATFTKDSYIFVKSGNLNGENVKWYLFESYTTGKEGTLIENKSEKMFIPGNVEVTFTLTVNEDGTLYLVIDYHTHTFGDATCTAPAKCECGATEGEALGHAYADGICGTCGAEDPNHYFVVSIPEALALADGKKVQLTGVVISAETWNTQYKNMSVTIRDAEGNTIYVFRLSTQVGLGDTITLKGVVGSYNDAKQIAQGATATIDVVHGDNHTYENGACTVCGSKEPAAGEETVKCDFSTVSGTQYADETKTFGDIAVSTHNKGCHFNSQLRIYDSSSNNGWAIVTAPGAITSLKVNVGYKAATLKVYGSVDGETWVLIQDVSTSTSYADYTVDVDETAGYKYIKLDASGAQLRVASLEVTYVK